MTREVNGKKQVVFEHHETPVHMAKSHKNTFQILLEDGVVKILLKEFYSKGDGECTLVFVDRKGKIILQDDRFKQRGQYNNIGFILADSAAVVEPEPIPEPPKPDPEPPVDPEPPPCPDCDPEPPCPDCVECSCSATLANGVLTVCVEQQACDVTGVNLKFGCKIKE